MTGINSLSSRQFVATALSLLLIPLQLPAKFRKPATRGDATVSAGLKIFILGGRGAVNFIPDKSATTPVVEVRDSNDVPVENVKVDFQLPESGPGGEFQNGKHLQTVITNTSGQASAPFDVNTLTGKFNIQVTAKIDTRMATAFIAESNSMKAGDKAAALSTHHFYTDWRFIALAGAGVAGLVVVIILTHGSGSNATNVVLTPGGPTFGTPH